MVMLCSGLLLVLLTSYLLGLHVPLLPYFREWCGCCSCFPCLRRFLQPPESFEASKCAKVVPHPDEGRPQPQGEERNVSPPTVVQASTPGPPPPPPRPPDDQMQVLQVVNNNVSAIEEDARRGSWQHEQSEMDEQARLEKLRQEKAEF